ncbi:hypothetical protein BWQ96_03727 [Gracilariopsis chorda]|uniref:BTB domain-containing protein n=1 Tax=Gracilariopsis chorda TaxID=448386 RepID=A0A2V3IWI2_9FLOR|nr:hypothetical protein BWQ96_03727 [Gracilariopsis chorda]|eukprot:PXF46492.1 hypothetical protein BWQ96_03727 [Gracilariopsis chorda]
MEREKEERCGDDDATEVESVGDVERCNNATAQLARPPPQQRAAAPTMDTHAGCFNAAHALQRDLQQLLLTPNPTDRVLHTADGVAALPPQIVQARSQYFTATLSKRWKSATPSLHSASKHAVHDLLEHLVTGVITLSSADHAISHNLQLAALAHQLLLEPLELVVVAHIAEQSLSNRTFVTYLTSLHARPHHATPAVEQLLCNHLLHNFGALSTTCLSSCHDHIVAAVWRLLTLATRASHFEASPNSQPAIVRYFVRIGAARLARILGREPTHNQHALRQLLMSFPSHVFAKHFDTRALFTPNNLLQKYRADALKRSAATSAPQVRAQSRTRFLCESPHPHPSAARLDATIRHIRLPQSNLYARLTFDKRSSLGKGARLAFYIHDPNFGAEAHVVLEGCLSGVITLPTAQFWYAFASATYHHPVHRDSGRSNAWGWRFFVDATSNADSDLPLCHLSSLDSV